jgi:hypothetical protein
MAAHLRWKTRLLMAANRVFRKSRGWSKTGTSQGAKMQEKAGLEKRRMWQAGLEEVWREENAWGRKPGGVTSGASPGRCLARQMPNPLGGSFLGWKAQFNLNQVGGSRYVVRTQQGQNHRFGSPGRLRLPRAVTIGSEKFGGGKGRRWAILRGQTWVWRVSVGES